MKSVAFFFLLSVYSLAALAQSSYIGGVNLEVKPSFSLENDWKLSTKLVSRIVFLEGAPKQSFNSLVNYDRTDLDLVLTKKVSSLSSLGGGYMIRLQPGVVKHRLIQQISISKKNDNLNLGHRIRFDETLQAGEPVLYRFRYRLSFEKYLNRETQKEGKTYFTVNNEYIPSVQGGKTHMEMRILPGFGFNLDTRNTIEAGIDYRVERVFTKNSKQFYLLYFAWIPDFD